MGGVSGRPWADAPLGRHPDWADTPHWADTPTGQTSPVQTPPRQTPPLGGHPPGRHSPWADTPQADTPQADTPFRADTPQQMATAEDGTHPTGMHSC